MKQDRITQTDWTKLKEMSDSEINFTTDAPRTFDVDWMQALAHNGLQIPHLGVGIKALRD